MAWYLLHGSAKTLLKISCLKKFNKKWKNVIEQHTEQTLDQAVRWCDVLKISNWYLLDDFWMLWGLGMCAFWSNSEKVDPLHAPFPVNNKNTCKHLD